MENSNLYVNVSVANIYGEAAFTSEVVTQALLGESLEVLKIEGEWAFVKQWDNYEGWINQFFTVTPNSEFLRRIDGNSKIIVGDLFGVVCKEPNSSSTIIRDLVYGNNLPILENKNEWMQVLLPNGEKGWTSVKPQDFSANDMRHYLVQEASRFIGIQYFWGGKSPKGFDCSGFVQTVMKSAGIHLPRDTQMQEDCVKLESIPYAKHQKGDLIFFSNNKDWVNHVAISTGGDKFIHCSGFVKIASFDKDDRLYDDQLSKTVTSVKSIKRRCH
ncbi:MAG: C40 family peptidase [Candidatus Marinimicrobia bacterium]|nr:C40 family peptidase [Candidatus Neomarinimicrobiota bacterium]